MTDTVERSGASHQTLLVIVQAVALWMVALLAGALAGDWRVGLAIGAFAMLGRLSNLLHWRRFWSEV